MRSNLTYMQLFRCVSQKYNLSFWSNFFVGVYFKISLGSVELQNKTLSTDLIEFETFIFVEETSLELIKYAVNWLTVFLSRNTDLRVNISSSNPCVFLRSNEFLFAILTLKYHA